MPSLSRNQKRRKKLAERYRRRASHRIEDDIVEIPLLQFEGDHLALEAILQDVAPGPKIEANPRIDQLLLESGVVHDSTVVRTISGQQQRCHENCALYFWLNQPSFQIVTGYAYMASMKRWARHSWLLDGTAIIETTLPRDFYFGVVLEGAELLAFFVNKCLSIFQDQKVTIETAPTGDRVLLTMPR